MKRGKLKLFSTEFLIIVTLYMFLLLRYTRASSVNMERNFCNTICKSKSANRYMLRCRSECSNVTTSSPNSKASTLTTPPTTTTTQTTKISTTSGEWPRKRTTIINKRHSPSGDRPTITMRHASKITAGKNNRDFLHSKTTPVLFNVVASRETNQGYFLKLAGGILGVCFIVMLFVIISRHTKRHRRVSFLRGSFSSESDIISHITVY